MFSAFIVLIQPFLPKFWHINLVIHAAINASIVYIITNIKKSESKNTNATIRNIANAVAATSMGHFIIFCQTIAKIIVATGNAKNNNKSII